MICYCSVFVFNQSAAYDMRISDWSLVVCSSDLGTFSSLRRSHAWCIVSQSEREPMTTPTSGETGVGSLMEIFRVTVNAHCKRKRGQIGRASCRERVCQYV